MGVTRRFSFPRLAAVGLLASLPGCNQDTPDAIAAQAPPSAAASSSAAPPEGSARDASSSAAPVAPKPPPEPEPDPPPAKTWGEQRAYLYGVMQKHMRLTDAQMAQIREIVEASPLLGQGRPDDTTYAMTRSECRSIRAASKELAPADPACGGPDMVRIYDPTVGETKADAKLCIDQYEFPDVPCEYPVTYASSREAALLCKSVGKRLCDAHEWEGACAGAVHAPEVEYHFEAARPYATWLHNESREIVWAYGPKKNDALCAMNSMKSERCDSTGLTRCGSNTYPAGAFPACVSPFGVYDQHGNAAEHMSLPLKPEELGARGGIGHTEMKGSWFVFARATSPPHPDDCRWRAKDWHPSMVMAEGSHRNYHLGFRCCKDIDPARADGAGG